MAETEELIEKKQIEINYRVTMREKKGGEEKEKNEKNQNPLG